MAHAPELPAPLHVTSRLLSLRGEQRANVLRLIGVAVFYAIEVVNYRGLSLGPIELAPVPGVDLRFHAISTALAVAWIGLAGFVFVALANQIFPPALKYFSTGGDLFLLTFVLVLADGPRSPMLLGYFLLIALAGLRFSVRLTTSATVAAVAGYGWLLLDVAYRRPELTVPPHWAVTTVVALALCGIVIGQMLRATRWALGAYAARIATPSADADRS